MLWPGLIKLNTYRIGISCRTVAFRLPSSRDPGMCQAILKLFWWCMVAQHLTKMGNLLPCLCLRDRHPAGSQSKKKSVRMSGTKNNYSTSTSYFTFWLKCLAGNFTLSGTVMQVLCFELRNSQSSKPDNYWFTGVTQKLSLELFGLIHINISIVSNLVCWLLPMESAW